MAGALLRPRRTTGTMSIPHAMTPTQVFRAEYLGRCRTCGSVSHPHERQGNPGRMGLPCGHPLTTLEPICPAEARGATGSDRLRWREQIRYALERMDPGDLAEIANDPPVASPSPTTRHGWAYNALWHAEPTTAQAQRWMQATAAAVALEADQEARCAA